ncbi:MAG: ribonuclease [Geobacteraceae bacterium]|nr:MAG: ribonuclease [Geobacteraceae bacterium]
MEPTFFSGLLDDPVLYVHVRPLGKGLLFDCGQIHHLAKRVLKSVEALFITHAHMDHFMGIDTLIRNVHVSPRTVDIFGPPGVAQKMAHKLAGYDWNLTEPYWCSFRVHEVMTDRIRTSVFPGSEGFPPRFVEERERSGRTIFRNACLQVEAELCDHKIPALVFRVTEIPAFLMDEGKIDRAGLVKGDWLRLLKKRFYNGWQAEEPLTVIRRTGGAPTEEPVDDACALYEAIRKEEAPASIGYLTDIGFNEENLAKVVPLLDGVTLLVSECSFMTEDREKARISHHLCADDLNFLAKRLRPRFLLPMHFSKTYIGRTHLLYEQLEIPPGVTLLRLPEHLAPRPLLAGEVPKPMGEKSRD